MKKTLIASILSTLFLTACVGHKQDNSAVLTDSGLNPQNFVTDINGKIIESNKIEQLSFIVDMTQLPKGAYFLTLIIDGKQDVWKIIKE